MMSLFTYKFSEYGNGFTIHYHVHFSTDISAREMCDVLREIERLGGSMSDVIQALLYHIDVVRGVRLDKHAD
jgi:hypothetical protein